MIYINSTNR